MALAFGRAVDAALPARPMRRRSSASITICSGPGRIRSPHAAAWAKRRGEIAPGQGRARLHVAECVPSLTGTVASTRLPCDASRLPLLAQAIGAQFALAGFAMPELREPEQQMARSRRRRTCAPIRAVRCSRSGRSSIRSGRRWRRSSMTSSAIPARRSGTASRSWRQPIRRQSLTALVADMAAGAVDTLVDDRLQPGLRIARRARFRQASRVACRTASMSACMPTRPRSSANGTCRCRIRWKAGATRARSTAARRIIQPVIAPLYASRSVHQFVDMLLGDSRSRRRWRGPRHLAGDIRRRFRAALDARAARWLCRRQRGASRSR